MLSNKENKLLHYGIHKNHTAQRKWKIHDCVVSCMWVVSSCYLKKEKEREMNDSGLSQKKDFIIAFDFCQ